MPPPVAATALVNAGLDAAHHTLSSLPAPPAVLSVPGIPGVDLSGDIARALAGLIGTSIHGFASAMFAHLSAALLATTAAPLGASFDAPWRAMLTVAALLAVPILLAGVATEVLAGRPAQAVKRGVAMPLLIGPVLLAARGLLGLLDALVQGGCGLMVQVGIGGPGGFAEGLDRIRTVLGVAAGPTDPTGAGASLVVVLVAAVLAFVIWIELAVRAALLVLLAAFVPLALSGLFWSATSRWTRRLVESLAAVLLAPLVITMVMVLATATLTGPATGAGQDIDHAAVALALLFLGTLGLPMTFRMVPLVVEAAAVAGTGASVVRRARMTVQQTAGQLATAGALSPAGAVAAGGAARLAAPRPPHSGGGTATGSGLVSAASGTGAGPGTAPRPARPPAGPASPAAAGAPTAAGGRP